MAITFNTTIFSIGISIALVFTVIYLIIQLRKRDSRIAKLQEELVSYRQKDALMPDLISNTSSESICEDDEEDDHELYVPLEAAPVMQEEPENADIVPEPTAET